MTYTRLPTSHLDKSTGLLRPACVLPERVGLDNPALGVMTDFRRLTAFIATPGDTIQQAEERMWRALGNLRQCAVLTALIIGPCIKATRNPPQFASGDRARELAASHARGDKIPRPRRTGTTQEALYLTIGISHGHIVP